MECPICKSDDWEAFAEAILSTHESHKITTKNGNSFARLPARNTVGQSSGSYISGLKVRVYSCKKCGYVRLMKEV